MHCFVLCEFSSQEFVSAAVSVHRHNAYWAPSVALLGHRSWCQKFAITPVGACHAGMPSQKQEL